MISNSDFGSISFDLPKNQSNVIKVIGVGGGGSNAINHMFKLGIKGVDFVVCNTDSQALQNSPVPNKIQLGVNLTEGLGAGANPEVGQQSAMESMEDIEKMLDTNTKMIFITAGMGGGTGTGAAPVIAQMAKEKDILTVGIVTMPFQFEGKVRLEQAMSGIERLRKQVDSLIVINNNKLREVYGNLGFKAGFSKADEVLATASRGIAEVITHHYTQNIDLKDAKTVLSNSGTAIMGSATASGENRAKDAIISALDSPLLNDNKITGAKNVLLLIVSGSSEITIDEIGEINDHIQTEAGFNANIIMGVGEDETLNDSIAVTIIATGFNVEQQKDIVNAEPKKIIHSLEDSLTNSIDLLSKVVNTVSDFKSDEVVSKTSNEEKIVFELVDEMEVVAPTTVSDLVQTTEAIKNIETTYEIVSPSFENQLIHTTSEIREIFVREPEFVIVEKREQIAFTFDLPTNQNKQPEAQKTILFDLNQSAAAANEIQVNSPIQVVPMTELNETGIVRYSLEEYMEVENDLLNSKPVLAKVEESVQEELNITMKNVEPVTEKFSTSHEEINPLEMTIEETLKFRADERRKKLKDFNYKFHNNSNRIEELEKEPAFKRSGVDISTNPMSNNTSRISLGTDSNDDIQLRSNNSFLHDNVD
ncbi:cell division protein FtsZ [Flavobacterium sp. UBA6135]|uniref:cell division protein FtsZ n=1 Tax=Flavobacterium sp. UBA6135 TaxID=1946553 RepID=UPI0025BFDBBF|nr:cell division protein FtsZ [Flavobacterium sp. UBA6135]